MARGPEGVTATLKRQDSIRVVNYVKLLSATFRAVRQMLPVDLCLRCGILLPPGERPLCARCTADLPVITDPICERCGRPLVSERRLCLKCREVGVAFDVARGRFSYRDRGAEIVRLYKIHDHPRLAEFFVEQLLPVLWGLAPERDGRLAIVPVPPRPARLRTYGWDPVGRLASRLAQRTGIPLIHALRRAQGASQKSLNLAGRLTNLSGKISTCQTQIPSVCLLLDDVMTTGATLSVCAAALKEKGAAVVRCILVAID